MYFFDYNHLCYRKNQKGADKKLNTIYTLINNPLQTLNIIIAY